MPKKRAIRSHIRVRHKKKGFTPMAHAETATISCPTPRTRKKIKTKKIKKTTRPHIRKVGIHARGAATLIINNLHFMSYPKTVEGEAASGVISIAGYKIK